MLIADEEMGAVKVSTLKLLFCMSLARFPNGDPLARKDVEYSTAAYAPPSI